MKQLSKSTILALFALLASAACTSPGTFDGDAGSGADTTEMPDGSVPDTGDDIDGEETGPDATEPDVSPDTAEPDGGGDAGCEEQTWYADSDGDGYGDPDETMEACDKPDGYVADSDDCDDSDSTINPDADEVCDGVDQNCNGTADGDEPESELVTEDCDKQQGVCSGATISSCTSDGTDYAECGADQYGDGYIAAGDEAWRCDGDDNDCDGTADEACCASGSTPTITQIGSDTDDQAVPAIAPAAQGAPSDAQFAVAWAVGQNVELWHVDETGSKISSADSKLTANVEGLDVVAHSSGYAVFAANASGQLLLLRFDANLQQQGTKQISTAVTPTLTNPSAVTKGQTAWVSYTHNDASRADPKFVIQALAVNVSNGMRTTDPFTVSQSGNELPEAGEPEMAIVSGTPTTVWWQAKSGTADVKVRGARLQPSRTVSERFDNTVQGASVTGEIEPIAAAAADGSLELLYPNYASGTGVLTHLEVTSSDTGSLSGGTAITGNSDTNRQPSAVPVDRDGDGTSDGLAVTWAKGSTGDPSIQVGAISLSSPSQMTGRTVRASGDEVETPDLANNDEKLGAGWLETVNGNERDVEYAPLSIDGVPICTPNP